MTRDEKPENQSGADSTPGQELDWLAFRYVSDELPDSEREEFEKRLETDSDAQSALVDVMRSTQLIYAALDADQTKDAGQTNKVERADRSNSSSDPASQGRRRSALLAAAAAILLTVAGWTIFNSSPNTAGVAVNNSQDSSELAIAWADTLTAREIVMLEAELDELSDEVEFVDFQNDDSSEEAKDWMYLALVELEDSVEVLE